MQHIIEGCGDRFQPEVTPELRDLIYRALLHPNRFVRETCYLILATVCRVCSGPELEGIANEVAARLQDGLSENWSQVLRFKVFGVFVCFCHIEVFGFGSDFRFCVGVGFSGWGVLGYDLVVLRCGVRCTTSSVFF
jgi:hypothetical protein